MDHPGDDSRWGKRYSSSFEKDRVTIEIGYPYHMGFFPRFTVEYRR